jgi:DNA polymerase elongation subunit (family B)
LQNTFSAVSDNVWIERSVHYVPEALPRGGAADERFSSRNILYFGNNAAAIAHKYMRVVTFDIETANWLGAGKDLTDLDIAIVCIHDSETNTYSSYLESELPNLWPILERTDMLVGYNSDHFDIPILNKYYPGDLTRIKSLDLMKEVYDSIGRRLKLDTLAEATLGTKKSGSGTQSLQWWKAGEVDKVRQYCLKDVEITRKLFEYALDHGKLHYKDFAVKHDVKLDTRRWLTPASSAMTFSLGL